MEYSEVSSEGWLSRLGGAFKGILFGLLLVVGAFVLLFWNEGRAVERHKTLEEGAAAVVEATRERIDPAHEGELVHVAGVAETGEVLSDPVFGVDVEALRLERRVEMYQWQEEERKKRRKKTGGGTRTTATYSYDETWSERPIDSSSFHRPEEHENPGSMPWETRRVAAERVTVGAFRLSRSLVEAIDRWRPFRLDSPETLPDGLGERGRLHDEGLYFGEGDPGDPEIGDVRVRFRVVEPTDVSVVARQAGEALRPFQTRAGGTIELLELGTVGPDEMFQAAQRRNTLLTWGLRLGGLLLAALGFSLVLRPFAVLADVLPPVGSLVGAGIGLVSVLLGAVFSLLTVSVAWVVYRPVLGIALISLAAAAVAYLVLRVRKAEPVTAGPASDVPPPPPPPPA